MLNCIILNGVRYELEYLPDEDNSHPCDYCELVPDGSLEDDNGEGLDCKAICLGLFGGIYKDTERMFFRITDSDPNSNADQIRKLNISKKTDAKRI